MLSGFFVSSLAISHFQPLPIHSLSGFNLFPAPVYAVEAQVSSSTLQGTYDDPNHPNCLREISVNNGKVTIKGSDSVDGSGVWVLHAIENVPGKILVDFSPKGGPKDLLGVFSVEKNRIEWPDGNAWTKRVSSP